jgi:hypothetical protein
MILGLLVFAVVVPHVAQAQEGPFRPEPVAQCLKSPAAADLEPLTDINPYYLRGDFDGDGKPDYAITARSPRTRSIGLVVCAGNGSISLLGRGLGEAEFSDMSRDVFIAPHWEVFTRERVDTLRQYGSNVPRPVPNVRAESIAMIWEDGISLIYWDGQQFRWAGAKY